MVVVWNVDQGAEATRTFVDSRIQLFNLIREHDGNYLGSLIYRSMSDPRSMIITHGLANAEEGPGLSEANQSLELLRSERRILPSISYPQDGQRLSTDGK